MSTDARVIFTIFVCRVGYAHVVRYTVSACVKPAYRSRGIGMMLLRLTEARAYEQGDVSAPGVGITLTTEVSHNNQIARRLLDQHCLSLAVT